MFPQSSFEITGHTLRPTDWLASHARYANWPAVYVLESGPGQQKHVYVGESTSVANRMKQHAASASKKQMMSVRVVLDETFNRSACQDLESHLIRWFDGDGQFVVTNSNAGMTDANYFDRETYRIGFRDVFDQLRQEGFFNRSIPEIENSDLFKLSPFKAPTPEQATAVESILEDLLEDLRAGVTGGTRIIEGAPGTGKTIVAIYLIKMLSDIARLDDLDDFDIDSVFFELFTSDNRDLLLGLRIGFVIPQQSLRLSVKKVFKKTPYLDDKMVMSQWDAALAEEEFDLLIVDEAHRLNQRANQSSGGNNKRYVEINHSLFGNDDLTHTQLDWIRAKSKNQILLLDPQQTVRPGDLPVATTGALIEKAKNQHKHYPLATQLRVRAGSDYVGFVGELLRAERPNLPDLGEYDFRVFDDLTQMRAEILARNDEVGLSRLVAGYAWEWISRTSGKTPNAFDIVIDYENLRWNRTDKDWINSPTSHEEVGSIHTVQGYDLNYAGVIIGGDLRYTPDRGMHTHKDWIADKKGKEDNPKLGKKYTSADLLPLIQNIYRVLMTRGMLGTYVYAVDPGGQGFTPQGVTPKCEEFPNARSATRAKRSRARRVSQLDPPVASPLTLEA